MDLTGEVYFRLLVLGIDPENSRRWMCKCSCGNEISVRKNGLRYGSAKSCGCFKSEQISASKKQHGQSSNANRSGTYSSWASMKTRCSNPKRPNYHNYGGRGIRVCDRWQEFSNFLEDMGDRPVGLTLERIDVDGHYCPENCRWASRKEQARNSRTNVLISVGGEYKPIAQASEETGVSRHTYYNQIAKGLLVSRTKRGTRCV